MTDTGEDPTTIGDVSMSVEAGMVAAMEQAEEIIRPIVDRAALSDSIRLYDLQVRIAKPLAEAADTIARLRAERDDARRIRDEHFREIERARSIIADLTAFRESVLTQRVSADWISVILSEDAHIENGQLENIPYLAVKIAEHVEATIARLESELSSLNAAGTRADGIEAAAAAVQQAITELGPGLSQYDRGQFDGLRTARSRIRALSPAPDAKSVVEEKQELSPSNPLGDAIERGDHSTATPVSGWRSMDSAPRDGSRIIALTDNGDVRAASWADWMGSAGSANGGFAWRDRNGYVVFAVAYMPLPLPSPPGGGT